MEPPVNSHQILRTPSAVSEFKLGRQHANRRSQHKVVQFSGRNSNCPRIHAPCSRLTQSPRHRNKGVGVGKVSSAHTMGFKWHRFQRLASQRSKLFRRQCSRTTATCKLPASSGILFGFSRTAPQLKRASSPFSCAAQPFVQPDPPRRAG